MKKGTAGKKRVMFKLEAPGAHVVAVAGTFNGWDVSSHLLKEVDETWQRSIYLDPGIYEYRFIVDNTWCNDPSCNEFVCNDFGVSNCVIRL